MAPEISVLLPVKDAEAYVRYSVESILRQRFADFELLLIDGGSQDGTREIVAGLTDARIRMLDGPTTGLSDQLNFGIQLARGKYIARMDADDYSLPFRFQRQRDYLESHPEIGVCGTGMGLFGKLHRGHVYAETHEDIACILYLLGNPLSHPTVMLRRRLLLDTGIGYRQEYFPAEDYQLWLDLLPSTRFHNLPEIHLLYRTHEGNTSSVHKREQQAMTRRIRMANILRIAGWKKEQNLAEAKLVCRFLSQPKAPVAPSSIPILNGFFRAAEGFGLTGKVWSGLRPPAERGGGPSARVSLDSPFLGNVYCRIPNTDFAFLSIAKNASSYLRKVAYLHGAGHWISDSDEKTDIHGVFPRRAIGPGSRFAPRPRRYAS